MMSKTAHLIEIKDNVVETNLFLSVEEAAALMKSTPQSLYLYLCRSGSQGGARRKRFPQSLYTRVGRKVLFIRERLVQWILEGASFEGEGA